MSEIEITDEMRSAVLNARGADDSGTFMPLAEMLRHCGESKPRIVADAILSAVAPLIAAQEREACAMVAGDGARRFSHLSDKYRALMGVAFAIRGRAESKEG